jgi:hypothetical protein
MQDLADPDISLLTISTEKELVKYDLDRLSEELTGKPIQRLFPIYMVFHKGLLRGFFQAPVRTVVYPAIHPDTCGPKEYSKIVKSLAIEIKRATGNPIFMLCTRANELGDDTLYGFGLKRSEEQAFEYCEE